ncbi:hypothetical protein [Lusitaniella coriacea]|uniref:hypothetical protein n=1 Tax=Lusitaniella coriacea TaxID=1983105 RepID=UPI003CF64B9C
MLQYPYILGCNKQSGAGKCAKIGKDAQLPAMGCLMESKNFDWNKISIYCAIALSTAPFLNISPLLAQPIIAEPNGVGTSITINGDRFWTRERKITHSRKAPPSDLIALWRSMSNALISRAGGAKDCSHRSRD